MLSLTDRGTIKQQLLSMNWPVKDDVPLIDGEHLDIQLREETLSGKKFEIRDIRKWRHRPWLATRDREQDSEQSCFHVALEKQS